MASWWFLVLKLTTSVGFGLVVLNLVPAMALNTVQVNVSAASSTFSYTIPIQQMLTSSNTPSVNYRIRGNINVILGLPNILTFVSVNTTTILLSNGAGNTIPVYLGGIMGGTAAPSTTPTLLILQGTNATIDMTGDLDESALTITLPPGTYSGNVVITAAFL